MLQSIKFLIGDVEPSKLQLVIMMLWPSIVSICLFYFGIKREEIDSKLKIFKLLAFIPLIAGIIMGYPLFMEALDPVYSAAYYLGTKGLILHGAVLFMPILVGIGLLVWSKIMNNSKDVF